MSPITSSSPRDTLRFGRRLGALLRADDVVTLSGDLGAGKTCLVKGVAEGLGILDPVTSPTFNILLVHRGRLTLNHFDLYRLDRAEQLEDIDFFGSLESGGASFVEWGERFPEALPADHMAVTITITGDDQRTLELVGGGPRSESLAEAWRAACAAGGDGR